MNPPFCPNPKCVFHNAREADYSKYWLRYGYHNTKVVGKVRRFKCKACQKSFSERTFSVHYYTKKNLDVKAISMAVNRSESLSSIGRKLGCNGDSITNRINRLCRSHMASYAKTASQLVIIPRMQKLSARQALP